MKKIKKKIKKKIFTKFFSEFKGVQKTNYTDFSKEELEIIEKVKPYTMTSPERIVSLIRAVNYIEQNNIEGSIVECGVWKGGSIMAALLTLKEKNRNIFLYDTFEGMSEPTKSDLTLNGSSALDIYKDIQGNWCYSSLEEVKSNILNTTYPQEYLNFIKGKVEQTIPSQGIPDKIALLRLDTDWYESTKHEMKYLFPKLVKGGIIIIDDYGHWTGCRKAIDEYISNNNIKLFLTRVDYTCRIGVKT